MLIGHLPARRADVVQRRPLCLAQITQNRRHRRHRRVVVGKAKPRHRRRLPLLQHHLFGVMRRKLPRRPRRYRRDVLLTHQGADRILRPVL